MTATIGDSSPEAGGRTKPRERPISREVLYGRTAEQTMVRDLLGRAERGVGGVVLVDGEPGIGRSLLLRDAIDEAAERSFSLAAGAADQLGQPIPFFALRAALREPSAELLTDDRGRDLPTAAVWWTTQIRANLEQRAAAGPVLVCLDDLHWASPATLAALRALPGDLKRHPVAWLLARSSTPQRAADYLFGLLEQDGAARLMLAPLDHDGVAAMLTDAFGAPPDQALADLASGAAGNPSLVAELIGGLRDDHAVQVTGGRAVLVCRRPDPPDPAGPADGCLAHIQVSVGVADRSELNIGQLRKAIPVGRKCVFEATPPACQGASEHVVPHAWIPDSAQPLVQPYTQPLRVLGIGEVRLLPISLRAASSVRSNENLPYSGRTLSSIASVGGDGGSLLTQISLSPLSVLAATAQNLGAFAGYPRHLDRTGEHGGIAS